MRASKLFLWVASAAYVLSLMLPTVNQGRGLIFAVWGFVAFAMARVSTVVWLANPAFVASAWMLFTNRSPVLRRVLAVVAVFVALFALTIDRSGGAHDGIALQTGYWVWLGSMVFLLIAALLPSPDPEKVLDESTVLDAPAAA